MHAVIAICLGACAGALARWQLGLWLNPVALTTASSNSMPQIALGTLAANWIGAYLIGVCMAVLEAWPALSPTWRLALITGFLGALTTFSSFSLQTLELLQQGAWIAAWGNVLGSVTLCLAATSAGWAIGRG